MAMTAQQIEFTKLKRGLMIHWGVGAAIPLSENSAEIGDGTEDINRWNPGPNYSVDPIIDTLLKLNCDHMVWVPKHCDGHILNESPSTPARDLLATDWHATYGRNPTRELYDACLSLKIKFILWFEVGDNYLKSLYGGFGAGYKAHVLAQITELATDFPEMFAFAGDAWGSFWTALGFPDFTHISIAEFENAFKSVNPNILSAINNHDTTSGEILTFEEPHNGEPKSGLIGLYEKPVWNLSTIFRTNLPISSRWFYPPDQPYEVLQPAARLALLADDRMLSRGYTMSHNIPCRLDGTFSPDMVAIINEMAQTTVPDIWRGLDVWFPLNEASGDALEAIHFVNSTGITVRGAPGTVTVAGAGKGRDVSSGNNFYYQPVAGVDSVHSLGDRTITGVIELIADTFGSYPIIFCKSYGSAPGFEYEVLLDTTGGGANAKPVFRVSADGTNYHDVTCPTNIVAGVKNQIVFVHNAEHDFISIQLNGGVVTKSDWADGIAESVFAVGIGCRDLGTNPFDGKVFGVKIFGRGFTKEEGTTLWNNGYTFEPWTEGSNVSFNSPPSSVAEGIIHTFKARNSDGTPATGLTYSSFTVAYQIRGGSDGAVYALTPEAATTVGTYEAPTAFNKCRIKEVGASNPTKGQYEIHLDNSTKFDGKQMILSLYAGDTIDVPPLKIDLVNDVSHLSGRLQSPRNLGSRVLAQVWPSDKADIRGTPTKAEFTAALPADFETLIIDAGVVRANNLAGNPISSLGHLDSIVNDISVQVTGVDGRLTDGTDGLAAIKSAAASAASAASSAASSAGTAATQATTAATQSTAANAKLNANFTTFVSANTSGNTIDDVSGGVTDLATFVRSVLPPGNAASRTWTARNTGSYIGSRVVIAKAEATANTYWFDVRLLLPENVEIGDVADIEIECDDVALGIADIDTSGNLISCELSAGTVAEDSDDFATITVTFFDALGGDYVATFRIRIT